MTRESYEKLLEQLDDKVLSLGAVVEAAVAGSVDALERRDVEAASRLIQADTLIDEQRYEIENQALLLIATQQPLAGDLRIVAAILTIATELERIGDYCEGIAKLVLRIAAEPLLVPLTDIRSMASVTERLLHDVLRAYKERNIEAAGETWMRDDEVDELYERVFRKLLGDMATDTSTVRQGTYLLWVAHNLERMADRVTNIAERVAFVVTGDIGGFRRKLRAQIPPE